MTRPRQRRLLSFFRFWLIAFAGLLIGTRTTDAQNPAAAPQQVPSSSLDWLRLGSSKYITDFVIGLETSRNRISPDSMRIVRASLTNAISKSRHIEHPSPATDDVRNRRVRIAGGQFRMGSPDGIGDSDEHPQHLVNLSTFYIQEHEVTNAEYRRFDPDYDRSAPDDFPVVGLRWEDAMSYAAWLGGSLPTEAQWEFVARGPLAAERKYPWGEQPPTCEHARFLYCPPGAIGAVKVGRDAGKTPDGVYDLIGNTDEWVRDWYRDSYDAETQTDPLGPATGTRRVLRGGEFGTHVRFLRSTRRWHSYPYDQFITIGFRVAWPEEAMKPQRPDSALRSNEWVARFAEGLDAESRRATPDSIARALATLGERVSKTRGITQPTVADDDVRNHRVRIAGGRFQMGSPEGVGRMNERPQHLVDVSPFLIQEHEVTYAEYWRFDPTHNPTAPGDLPVGMVSWHDAAAYAAWLGGSLPTEAQWEFAARGPLGADRKYPWGNQEPTCDRAQFVPCNSMNLARVKLGRELGKTPEGLYDMAGNVFEWVRDWYAEYDGSPRVDPLGPATGQRRVLRGGSFAADPEGLRGADRASTGPRVANDQIGFRVVWPVPRGKQ